MHDQDLLERVEAMSAQEIDGLPVGVITLGLDGKILRYNRTEAEMARLDQRSQVGRNFFTEVAPCTANPEFQGRFTTLAGKSSGGIETFDYTFRFAWGAQRVHITFVHKAGRDDVDVLITRMSA